MLRFTRREWMTSAAATITVACLPKRSSALSDTSPETHQAAKRGRNFLVSLLDSELDLLPEYRGANVYWLFHDNYLASKVLKTSHPEIAKRIETAIASHGIARSGKIEILFSEAEKPLPFRRYTLVEVKQIGNKTLKTEVVENELLKGWEEYADLLLFSSIALAGTDNKQAVTNFEAAAEMWDEHGFHDRVVKASKQYATYKLALFLIAAAKLKNKPPIHDAVLKKLLAQQAEDGGWITDYNSDGQKLGLANVETTSMAVLALTPADSSC